MIKEIRYCKCGCGSIVQKNYKKGHGRKGKKNSPEHNKALIEYNKNKILTDKQLETLRFYNINRIHTEETKKKMSETAKEKGFGKWMLGKTLSDETKNKISKKLKGHIKTEYTKRKISLSKMGDKNGMFGKTHSDEYKEKLRLTMDKFTKNAHSPESIKKMRLTKMGQKASDETRKKMRISKINYIREKNGGVCPMHNKKACEYFDDLSKINNWKLQHALNGGEFYISSLGYFVDAYDIKNNIIIEYDEPLHYDSKGNLKVKDIVRQNEIIEKLKCRFFRYNEKKNELYEI